MPAESMSAEASTKTTSAMPDGRRHRRRLADRKAAHVVPERDHATLRTASTTFSFDARHAGRADASRAEQRRDAEAEHDVRRLEPEVREEAAHVLLDEAAEAEVDEAARRGARPSTPPSTPIDQRLADDPQRRRAAARSPMARSTPYSLVRSRTPIAIVLPRMSVMMTRMTAGDDVHRLEDRREHRQERRVEAALVLRQGRRVAGPRRACRAPTPMSATCAGSSTRLTIQPTWSRRAGRAASRSGSPSGRRTSTGRPTARWPCRSRRC